MLPNPTDHAHLIVFGRYPRVGETKTRLIPALGPAGAAALQKRLTEKTVATARKTARKTGVRLVFCHDGGDAQQLGHWLGKGHMEYVPQASGNLGSRMFLSIQRAFDQGARQVVLIGTDIPRLTADILDRAFESLTISDLVLGPSTDGGYWLVGMNRLVNVFGGITWSNADVLKNTLSLAKKEGLKPFLLDPLSDLDTPGDLERERMMGWRKPITPFLSVIIPVLNEKRQIAQTISSAASVDAQIIVSDGGSTDRTVEIARSLGARIVSGKKGRAGQQNRGAAAAQGEVLLFLHADTHLPRNYVTHIFEALMDRQTVMGAFRFASDRDTPAMRLIALWTNRRADWLNLPYGDQGLFMRRRMFNRVGGFPDVPIAEDLYLVRAMGRRGRIALAPVAAVTSARRWRQIGMLRTTLVNTIIAAGCLAGVTPDRLAPLYRLPLKKL